MKLRSIDEAMEALYAYVPNVAAMKANYSLDRIQEFLAHIGDPQEQCRVIHVAGTSGKTSTAYFIRALLDAAGQTTGLTISPHMVSVTERVQVHGRPLPDRDFLYHLERFLPLVESSGIRLTYFEVLIAFVYWVLPQYNVTHAIIETGLGGLLDGTNVVSRPDKVCAITDIGLDHTEILGETITEIAVQKAGIIQPGNHVFIIDQDVTVMDVVAAEAEARGATLHTVIPDDRWLLATTPTFQRRNLAVAVAVYEHVAQRDGLPAITDAAVRQAVNMPPPGRMERYELEGKVLILDGAHNPQKLSALRTALEEGGVQSAAVLASLVKAPEHKLDASLAELQPLTRHLIVPEFTVMQDVGKESPPASDLAGRAHLLGFRSVEVQPRLDDAFAALLRRPEPTLIVTGSLYLVSLVRALVEKRLGDEAHHRGA